MRTTAVLFLACALLGCGAALVSGVPPEMVVEEGELEAPSKAPTPGGSEPLTGEDEDELAPLNPDADGSHELAHEDPHEDPHEDANAETGEGDMPDSNAEDPNAEPEDGAEDEDFNAPVGTNVQGENGNVPLTFTDITEEEEARLQAEQEQTEPLGEAPAEKVAGGKEEDDVPSFMKVPAHKIGVVPDVSPTGLPQTKFSDFKEDMDRDGSDSITVDEVKMRLEYIQELDAAVSVKFFSDVHKVDSHFTPIEILKFQRNVDDFTKEQFNRRDDDKDGFLSWSEFSSVQHSTDQMSQDQPGDGKRSRRIRAARNNNQVELDHFRFNMSDGHDMKPSEKDGKLSLSESVYMHNAYIKEAEDMSIGLEAAQFILEYDMNSDGRIGGEEMKMGYRDMVEQTHPQHLLEQDAMDALSEHAAMTSVKDMSNPVELREQELNGAFDVGTGGDEDLEEEEEEEEEEEGEGGQDKDREEAAGDKTESDGDATTDTKQGETKDEL